MKKKIIYTVLAIIVLAVVILVYKLWFRKTEVTPQVLSVVTITPSATQLVNWQEIKSATEVKLSNVIPQEWSLDATGVYRSFKPSGKQIALTFDACSGSYDKELIDYLVSENVPATLFLTGKWVDANLSTARELVQNQLFDVENHGENHKPCSISGKDASGIVGTKSVGEVFDEIMLANDKLIDLGVKPELFRPGTAYADEYCSQIAGEVGYKVVGFILNGDAGATFTAEQIKTQLDKVQAGNIVIFHMNHPEKQTSEGLKLAIPELKKQGFEFVRLRDVELE